MSSRLRHAFRTLMVGALIAVFAWNQPGMAQQAQADSGATAFQQKDYEKALRLSTPAAEAGDAAAQYRIGMMKRFGWGGERDAAAALSWFTKSAEQGYTPAAGEIGKIYKDGRGVQKNPAEAVKWFRVSANDGFGISQLNLARMLRDGEGAEKDPVEAYAWFSLAIDNQYMDAIGHRNRLVDDMTSEQIQQGKALAERLRASIKPRTPEQQ